MFLRVVERSAWLPRIVGYVYPDLVGRSPSGLL